MIAYKPISSASQRDLNLRPLEIKVLTGLANKPPRHQSVGDLPSEVPIHQRALDEGNRRSLAHSRLKREAWRLPPVAAVMRR